MAGVDDDPSVAHATDVAAVNIAHEDLVLLEERVRDCTGGSRRFTRVVHVIV